MQITPAMLDKDAMMAAQNHWFNADSANPATFEHLVAAYLNALLASGKAVSAFGEKLADDSYCASTWATDLEPVLIIRLEGET